MITKECRKFREILAILRVATNDQRTFAANHMSTCKSCDLFFHNQLRISMKQMEKIINETKNSR
jgi:hypothetical protein